MFSSCCTVLLSICKASLQATRAAKVSVCTTLAWPRALTRTIIARYHAQHRAARARGASPAAPAPSNCAGHAHAQQLRLNFAWRARARANPVAARRRSISRESSRACTCPPAFLRRFQPEDFKTPNPRASRLNAAPSARRITTRRRIAVRGAISTRVPSSSPSRHARSTP